MNQRYRDWLGQHYIADTSMHRRLTNLDLDHHLLGNGRIQTVVQVTRNEEARNAIVLHLMNPDRFEGRDKTDSFTFHQQLGPEYTFVGVVTDEGIHIANPRQTSVDLQYGLRFSDGDVPVFWASYPLDYTLTSRRTKTGFDVAEEMFVPEHDAALLRRVTVTNSRGLSPTPAKLLVTLTPNQELFPNAHHVTKDDVSVAGNLATGDEFLSLSILNHAAKHMVAEFPIPLEAIVDGTFGADSQDDENHVQPRESYRNYPAVNGHVGPVLAYEIDLGDLASGDSVTVDICYAYADSEEAAADMAARFRSQGYDAARAASAKPWLTYNHVDFGDRRLDVLFSASKAGLHASVAESGRMNAGIWGYNAEWVRDSSLAAVGVILSGQHEIARTMLTRVLEGLIDESGMGFGESRFYSLDEAELDQNGELLYALWQYWVHTRDDEFIRQHWDRIRTVAEFPIGPEFWVEEARMVQSTRDIRERDRERHGLEPGFDLGHQMWVTIGLEKAAELAAVFGSVTEVQRWRKQAERIWNSVLTDPDFRLVENDHFIFRRRLDGSVQREAVASVYVHRPTAEPITQLYPRNLYRESELEPASFEAWPVALGLIDPSTDVARRTLVRMEKLWNDEWDFGGYGLHNVTSETTKRGPWPMSFYMITQAAVEAQNWKTVRRNLDWVMSSADGRGYMWWEYRDADPKFQIDHAGVIPWLAYGEAVALVARNILGYQPLSDGICIRPRLLPETKHVSASLRSGQHTVELTVHNNGPDVTRATVDGTEAPITDSGSLLVPVPQADIDVHIWTE